MDRWYFAVAGDKTERRGDSERGCGGAYITIAIKLEQYWCTKINKNKQNPLRALGAMLLVQIVTKNSLQASLQIVFTTNSHNPMSKSSQRHKHKKHF